MKSNFYTSLLMGGIIALFSSCHPIRSVNFSESFRHDTVMFQGGTNYLGPYFIMIDKKKVEQNKRQNLLSAHEEKQEIFGFSLCQNTDCVMAESYFYTKTKTTKLIARDRGITKEKLHGNIRFNGNEIYNFMVDVGGKQSGKGFLKSPDGMIDIMPISRKSNYGKSAYGVGLEFKQNGQPLASFIQDGEAITVVLKAGQSSRMQMVLSALAVAVVNRSNEIILL